MPRRITYRLRNHIFVSAGRISRTMAGLTHQNGKSASRTCDTHAPLHSIKPRDASLQALQVRLALEHLPPPQSPPPLNAHHRRLPVDACNAIL